MPYSLYGNSNWKYLRAEHPCPGSLQVGLAYIALDNGAVVAFASSCGTSVALVAVSSLPAVHQGGHIIYLGSESCDDEIALFLHAPSMVQAAPHGDVGGDHVCQRDLFRVKISMPSLPIF